MYGGNNVGTYMSGLWHFGYHPGPPAWVGTSGDKSYAIKGANASTIIIFYPNAWSAAGTAPITHFTVT
jgi:hypothetical protein